MVQESTMICVDNSEWMRNGDFAPTRLQCQQDAVNLVLQCKLRANPENAVGLISMADTVEVLTTLTQENGKLFMKLHQVKAKGESNFINGIKVAHLALKHRQNRNHKMRIVLFVGSPIDHLDPTELTKLAKKLKKEKVQVDVVCFGEAGSDSSEVMGQFVEALNGRDGSGSNLVVVPSSSTLTEALAASPICRGEDGAAAPVVAAGGAGFDFGIDPDDDPDLALALRVSLEEQRQRQMQEAGAAPNAPTEEPTQESHSATNDVMSMDPGAMTEEQQLEWALRMSMQETLDGVSGTTGTGDSGTTPTQPAPAASTEAPPASEQPAVTTDQPTSEQPPVTQSKARGSIEEPMEVDATPRSDKSPEGGDDQLGQLMDDPELLRQLVADLPGVDPNSQEVRDVLDSAASRSEKKDNKNEKKEQK